jgi:hypothetical protein
MKPLYSLTAAWMLIYPTVMMSASQITRPINPAVRRAPEARPAPSSLLPPGAERVAPLKLDVLIRRQASPGRAERWHQTIHRTADRIYVAEPGRREWLFERNVRDVRRVSGSLIDHGSRTIIVYEESDLRNAFGIAGWAKVLALGIDPGWLSEFVTTEEARIVGGIHAVRYTPVDRRRNATEVWWSADEVLPVAFTIADGTGVTRFSIERVDAGVDATLLRSPASRFPTYAVVQFADWLERH